MMHHFWPFLLVAFLLIGLARATGLAGAIGSRGGLRGAGGAAGRPDPRGRPTEAENARLRDEMADLRERVRVLERIAIEDRHPRRLAAEIDRLREE